MAIAVSAPHLHSEEAAYAFVEARVWPEGPICPHCGCTDRISAIKPNPEKRVRIGLKKCGDCGKQFTVKVGTIFEQSHVPLRLWLQAMALITSSKKGISSNQLHRMLGVTLKTAWFMSHRIREAMADGSLEQFGGGGGDVEADETFIGYDPDTRPTPKGKSTSWVEKRKVLSLVDRNSGHMRSFVIASLTTKDVRPILLSNIAPDARLLTDEAPRYRGHGRFFADHQVVNHSKDEYVRRDDPTVHTNTVEGTFSIFKRGMRGVYQHCAKKHMQRYLAEFDFRFSTRSALGFNDAARVDALVKGIVGKRLTYRTTSARREGAEDRVVW